MFEINTGIIVTAVAMLVFYLRIAMLRGRKRRLTRQEALERRKLKKANPEALRSIEKTGYQVRSWWLVGLGAVLMLVGVVMYTANWMDTPYDQYWWIATSGGVLIFAFSLK